MENIFMLASRDLLSDLTDEVFTVYFASDDFTTLPDEDRVTVTQLYLSISRYIRKH